MSCGIFGGCSTFEIGPARPRPANGIELSGRAPNDGYTLLTVASNITILPVTNKNANYNLLRDFAPISQLINSPSVLLVNPGLSVNSVVDFIAAAKARPGELSDASAGIGTQPHMGMELLAVMAGIRIQHIPYKGVAPAMTDVIGGRVSFAANRRASLRKFQGTNSGFFIFGANRWPRGRGLPVPLGRLLLDQLDDLVSWVGSHTRRINRRLSRIPRRRCKFGQARSASSY